MTEAHELTVALLVEYQAWSHDRVCSLERAKSVIEDMVTLATMKAKTNAVEFLVGEGWCETKTYAKKLVDAVWKYRRDIDQAQKMKSFAGLLP